VPLSACLWRGLAGASGEVVQEYCAGITIATDWGDEAEQGVDRRLVRRVLGYLRPYWRAAVLALGCIAIGALLGLAPALVFAALIDHLAGEDRSLRTCLHWWARASARRSRRA